VGPAVAAATAVAAAVGRMTRLFPQLTAVGRVVPWSLWLAAPLFGQQGGFLNQISGMELWGQQQHWQQQQAQQQRRRWLYTDGSGSGFRGCCIEYWAGS
jgi:hypothetical protein